MRKAARKAAAKAIGQSTTRAAGEIWRPLKRDESLYNKASCPMRFLSDAPDEADWKPGDYWFADVTERQSYQEGAPRYTYPALWACFPDGSLIHIPLRPAPEGYPKRAAWTWDGNRTSPTLSPSVHIVGTWHGWVQAGRMQSV